MTLTARQVADLLTTHGLRPSRALGQNFVTDPNTVRRVVRLAEIAPGDRVVEVGPGLGSLTVALADAGAQVTAVEVDSRLIPVLEAVLGAAPVRVVQADALHMDWAEVLGPEPGWLLVANLPYNIATPLIATVLDSVPVVTRLVVMVQREVADRLVALPGHGEYGAVSVKVAYWADADVVANVPPTVFVPRPKVDSALVSIRRRPVPAVDPHRVDPELLFRLVRAGFAKRRKMLRRSLAGLVPPGAFEAAEVRPDNRAENLDVYAWGRLAAAVGAAAAAGDGVAPVVLDTVSVSDIEDRPEPVGPDAEDAGTGSDASAEEAGTGPDVAVEEAGTAPDVAVSEAAAVEEACSDVAAEPAASHDAACEPAVGEATSGATPVDPETPPATSSNGTPGVAPTGPHDIPHPATDPPPPRASSSGFAWPARSRW